MQIPKHKSKKKRIAIVLSLFIVLLLIIGGYIGWREFMRLNDAGQTKITESSHQPTDSIQLCSPGDDTKATSGVFCSDEIGIKIPVPKLFAGKIEAATNYPIYQSQLAPNSKTPAGTASHVYQADVTTAGRFVFTIAQEPLRTGYMDVYHAQQNSYFDSTTKELTRVISRGGQFIKGEPLPSFMSNGLQIFQASNTNGLMTEESFLMLVNDAIVRLTLQHTSVSGDAATAFSVPAVKRVFAELDTALKTVEVI
ncbi:MAG: hypothetical protein WAS27_00485 [Candidatus Saccharimonadales bacterium]